VLARKQDEWRRCEVAKLGARCVSRRAWRGREQHAVALAAAGDACADRQSGRVGMEETRQPDRRPAGRSVWTEVGDSVSFEPDAGMLPMKRVQNFGSTVAIARPVECDSQRARPRRPATARTSRGSCLSVRSSGFHALGEDVARQASARRRPGSARRADRPAAFELRDLRLSAGWARASDSAARRK